MTSQMKTARIAGLLYLILIPVGIFWFMYAPSVVRFADDMPATLDALGAHQTLFRISIATGLAMNAISVVLALMLYKLFSPVAKNAAVSMLALLAVGAAISLVTEMTKVVIMMISHPEMAAIFSPAQQQYIVATLFELHHAGNNIAGVFWGLWLFPLGWLIVKSGFMPKMLGILLAVAGVGYVFDSFIYFTVPGFPIVFANFTFLGEVSFTLWLVFRGVRS